ncbi:sulfite exporter TauE/SafE family protein [Metabacillus sp. GX 13764]|uniref:sulfite exporter TauE/SafE family protein n=1 Tax=Metabacillus kandeliae TaxID=2900151 RepID=UPI001E2C992E|nr:sulfite exporter TauE/SafE family protein [Metabacillus kandeliae]MCD7035939.1 sulfite exporter TauE/SafE family protein [Metabacillus kandeliae]
MDWAFIATLLLIGFAGSFLSGMLGIGGAIINFPLLLYVPALVGVAHYTSHEVSAITAIQVFFASLGGIYGYRNSGYLNKGLVLYMGISVLAGSLIGGYGSGLLPESAISLVYGVLALLAVILMFIPKKGKEDRPAEEVTYNKTMAVIISFVIGIAAGIVGAGGAFLLVPVMLTVMKIPTRMTIATSLAVTFLSSIGSVSGKVLTGQVEWLPSLIIVIATLIASPLGARAGKKTNPKVLQTILAVLILATAIKIWAGIL